MRLLLVKLTGLLNTLIGKNMKNKIIVITIALIIGIGIFLNQQLKSEQKTALLETNNASENNSSTLDIELTVSELTEKKTLATHTEAELPFGVIYKRNLLKKELHELLNCHKSNSCPIDNSDPRASDLLLGQQITAKLNEYKALALENDYYDDETAAIVKKFITNSNGYVQESAIDLMSAMPPNSDNAQTLIKTLETSYDAKIMNQSMKELQRYPQLSSQVDKLYQKSLQTGSFYVAQEIAMNILPQLNTQNIEQYTEVANNLPQNSKRADALWSNINEFNLRQKGG